MERPAMMSFLPHTGWPGWQPARLASMANPPTGARCEWHNTMVLFNLANSLAKSLLYSVLQPKLCHYHRGRGKERGTGSQGEREKHLSVPFSPLLNESSLCRKKGFPHLSFTESDFVVFFCCIWKLLLFKSVKKQW